MSFVWLAPRGERPDEADEDRKDIGRLEVHPVNVALFMLGKGLSVYQCSEYRRGPSIFLKPRERLRPVQRYAWHLHKMGTKPEFNFEISSFDDWPDKSIVFFQINNSISGHQFQGSR